MGPFYRNALAAQGYEEAAIPAIDDDLLDTFEEIKGVDAVAVSFPRSATTDEISATLERLSPQDSEYLCSYRRT